MKRVPEFLRRYFWDIDFDKLDTAKNRMFVLKRILEYGDERAARWMKKNYTRHDVENILYNYRIDPKSGNFWALFWGIDRKKVRCLQRSYLKIRKKIWPY